MGVRSLLLFGIKLLDLSDREFCDSGDRANGEGRSLVSTPLRSLLALIVEPGCQVIDHPKIQQGITKGIKLLDRQLPNAIDHRISGGSNLQTQPTKNFRSPSILRLESFGLGDRSFSWKQSP
jgi:hypothetical protein